MGHFAGHAWGRGLWRGVWLAIMRGGREASGGGGDMGGGPEGRGGGGGMGREGPARRVAGAEFASPPQERDGERIRWYLEDYAEFPADPAPEIARAAETQLAQQGTDLFRQVF